MNWVRPWILQSADEFSVIRKIGSYEIVKAQ